MTALQDQLDEITANTRSLCKPSAWLSTSARPRTLRVRHRGKDLPSGPQRRVHVERRLGAGAPDLLALGARAQFFPRAGALLHHESRHGANSTAAARVRSAAGCHRPQTQRQSDFMWASMGFRPVLADPGCAVAERFGLAYTIPGYHRDYYRPSSSTSLRQRRRFLAPPPCRHLRHQPATFVTPRPTRLRVRPNRKGPAAALLRLQ